MNIKHQLDQVRPHFFENIFFPFPSDAIVIPMSISKPKKWFETFMIASVAAFLGSIVAYAIGSFMFHKLGVLIFELSGIDDPKKYVTPLVKPEMMMCSAELPPETTVYDEVSVGTRNVVLM